MRSIFVAGTALLILSVSMAAEPPEAARAHLFPRTTYSWPFGSGPSYGEIATSRWDEPGILHTRVGSFDLKRGSPALPAELRAAPESRYAIVQVDPAAYADGRFDRIRGLLESQGGALLEAMAVSAHVVRATPQLQGLLRAQDGVLALEPYHPAFKLAPTLGRLPLADPARATSEIYRLEATVFRGEDAHAVAASLKNLGAAVARVDPDVVFFELSRERLADVARLDAVKAVHETLPNLVQGQETSVTVQTGTWGGGAVPYNDAGVRGDGNGLTGTTPEILMVLDSGLQLDAGDLSDTRTGAGTPGPAHRKVLLYTTAVGGTGDALGCDTGPQGGFTHGHVVAATALGNATDVAPAYGPGWQATDAQGGKWKLDGVAPRAKLVLYDAQVTPSALSCADPEKGGLLVGTLYLDDVPGSGSLGDAYARGARVFNFSWGTTGNNTYGTNAQRADQFLFDQPDAALFVSAGNAGIDAEDNHIPDPLTVSDPATCKSCIVVGASGVVDDPEDGSNQEDRAAGSGVGPVGATSRIAPLLMAPGHDFGNPGVNMGMDSPYACRTNDNDQSDPVECDLVQSLSSTSFAAAAASGAALLVRDWFQQGFYPDGTSSDPGNAADQVPNISGALLKAILVTSADWMEGGDAVGGNTSVPYRFNREQGYGRIQLSNALPLSTYAASPSGIVVSDGGIAGGRVDLAGIPGMIASAGTTQTGTLRVEDGTRELRCALAWTEDAGDALAHDLDLEMVSPSGKVYFGNFFNEDVDGDNVLDPGENCHDRGLLNTLDQEIWSIETNSCGAVAGTRHDTRNPVEAVFLSPTLSQVEVGDWSLRVVYRTGTGTQPYAVSCSGPIATRSTVRFDRTTYACADQVRVTVVEASDPQDPGITAAEVASRTTVQVLDAQGMVRDSETGLSFSPTGLRFDASLYVTDGTAYDSGNGVLDVRHGDRLRVLYADETSGAPDPAKLATGEAEVDCQAHVALGGVVWATWGKDASTLVKGGCERDARNLFTFGFPDKFMDAGELINYRIAFQSAETVELSDFQTTLRCVHADADSPAACAPGSTDCPDPDRRNNSPCTEMTILDTPQLIGLVPPDKAVSVNFNIEMAATIAGTPKVDMLLGITARQSGRTVEKLIASRHVLDADEISTFYSTDFPTGGTEIRDFNGNETVENPTTDPVAPTKDYLFESRTYGDLTAGGTKNTALQAPWNFDGNDGGFRVGLNPATTDLGGQVIANWGEDTNFNGVLDPGEDRDPVNGVLDENWNTLGGCGWQTRGAQATGGIWHTGTIGLPTGACGSQCELVDTISGSSQTKHEFEMLVTPVVEKVHTGLDADGDPTHRLEITNWAWNMEMDLKKTWDIFLWELDTDTQSVTRADLFRDQTILNFIGGIEGALSGGNAPLVGGFPVFAPFQGTSSVNGSAGINRVGKNGCLFEAGPRQADSTLGLAKPADDDVDNDGDLLVDEYVTANGPIRNFDLTRVNGPDMRFNTLDDIYGDAGNSFQGALGFWVQEGFANQPQPGYGVGVDDMVVEWREVARGKDATDCASGACATLSFDVTNGYEGAGSLSVTVLDASPWDPAQPVNDCNGDGDFADPGDDQDCDDDGTQDLTVSITGGATPAMVLALDRAAPGGAQWKGSIPYALGPMTDGMLQIVPKGYFFPPWPPFPYPFQTFQATVTARYDDRDDGTGQRCRNDANPALQGFLEESTTLTLQPPVHISVAGVRLQDNGDHDGFADPNETVTLFVTLHNNAGVERRGVVLRLSSNNPSVDCILDPVLYFGSLGAHETKESTEAFTFHVANVTRSSVDADLSASFNVFIRGDTFEDAARPQTVTVDLDLNVSGGLIPGTYTEGFEGGGFGSFTTMSLDAGRESLALSNGYRCQYNDPDFANSNSYGNTFCYLGAATAAQNGYDWHVHTTSSPDGGRAYLGNNSLHWGVHSGAASADTTRLKQLDAVRSFLPVNLGWNGVTSELSFKHQVGLTDCDYAGCSWGYNVDRGIVQVQLANSAAQGVGSWRKISPYENLYETQTTDNYTNCLFDPVDDGNTEDDYFDPTDPERRLGPSSTCAPEFSFSRQGAIFYADTFDAADIHHASDGPGLQGSRGPGTWVQVKFDLSRYRGRRIRIRFLTTSIEVANALTMQQALGWNPIPADDGWYIDDIKVTNTVTGVSTVTVDTADRTALPGCGIACSSITADLVATPSTTAGPGQATELSAAPSFADRCTDGLLQFRFWNDQNGNSVVGDAGDLLLRTWSANPVLLQAPSGSTRYGVEVRCSSLPSCLGSTTALVTVPCPSTGNAKTPFDPSIGFPSKTQLSWPTEELVDVIRGDLGLLRSSGGQFNGTVEACLGNDVSVSSLVDPTLPASGAGKYYLVRGAGPSPYCNATPSWKTGSAAEKPGAGGDRDADLALDPGGCP